MEGSVSLTPQVQGSPTYSSPELPPRQPVGQGRTIDTDPTRLPSVRPVAPAGSTGVTDAGALQGFVQLFGGSRISGQVTKDSLAASGARVSNSLFDLIDRGMKIEGEEGLSTGDGVLTEEEIQQFFSNVSQFAQMAQLPQTEAELARVALLYNKEGGKYTRVSIEDLQQIGASIMQAWTGDIPEPYKKAAEFYPRATQPVLDGISRKINSGKAFAEAGMEGQQKALMALQLADSFAININELYDFGERPAMTGKMSEARKQEEAAMQKAFDEMSSENQAKFKEFLTLSQDRAKQKEAMEKWEEIKKDMPPEIVSPMDKDMAEIRQAEEEQKQIEAKIPKTKAAADKGDIDQALREFETEKAGLTHEQALSVETGLKTKKIITLLQSGNMEEASKYYESVKANLPPEDERVQMIVGIFNRIKAEAPIREDLAKMEGFMDELGKALSDADSGKIDKYKKGLLSIFEKNKGNPDFWLNADNWSRELAKRLGKELPFAGQLSSYDSAKAFVEGAKP